MYTPSAADCSLGCSPVLQVQNQVTYHVGVTDGDCLVAVELPTPVAEAKKGAAK